MNCYLATGGEIDINVTTNISGASNAPGGLTYNWTGPNGFVSTDEDINELEPGMYTVTVASSVLNQYGNSAGTRTKSFYVGYRAFWKNLVNVVTNQNDLGKEFYQPLGNNSGASSVNLLPAQTDGEVSFMIDDSRLPNNGSTGGTQELFSVGLTKKGNAANFTASTIDYGIRISRVSYGGVGYTESRLVYEVFTNNNGLIQSNNNPQNHPWYSPPLGSGYCEDGDIFSVGRLGNGLVFKRNGIVFHSLGNFIVNTISNLELVADASIHEGIEVSPFGNLNSGFQIINTMTTFPCIADAHPQYGELQKKLDGNYYVADQGQLFVKYKELYKAGDLSFKIYDQLGNEIIGSTQVPTQKQIGANWIHWNLNAYYTSLLTFEEFYILEIINDKKQTEYLRFQYWDLSPTN